MILFLTFGGGYGLFNGFSTFLEQIVCPNGYDDVSVVSIVIQEQHAHSAVKWSKNKRDIT